MPSSAFQKSALDRKSTRLNSSHTIISYAVFCLTKKDRKALIHEAVYGNNLFFDSDSDTHLNANKESACGCAGIFVPGFFFISRLPQIFTSFPQTAFSG